MEIIDFEDLPDEYKKLLDAANKNKVDEAFNILKDIKKPLSFWYSKSYGKDIFLINPLHSFLECYLDEKHYEIIFKKFEHQLFYENLSSLTREQHTVLKEKAHNENKELSYFLDCLFENELPNRYEDSILIIIRSLSKIKNSAYENNFKGKNKENLFNNIKTFIKVVKEKKIFSPSEKLIDEILDSVLIGASFDNNLSFTYKEVKSIYDVIVKGDEKLEDYLKYSLFSKRQYEPNLISLLDNILNAYIDEGFVPNIKNIQENKSTLSFFNHYFDHVIKSRNIKEMEKILLNPEAVNYSPFMFGVLMKQYITEKKKDKRTVIKKVLDFMLDQGLDANFLFQEDKYSEPESIQQFFNSQIVRGHFHNKTEKSRQNEMISYYNNNKLLMEKNYILNHLPVMEQEKPLIHKKKRI